MTVKKWLRAADAIQFPIWIKDPDDVEDYTLDWAARLVGDDFIIAADFICSAELHIVSVNFTHHMATVWLSGGIEGSTYEITCRITTDAGRVHERTFQLVMAQK